jgi:CRP-like cAMP-binding protein
VARISTWRHAAVGELLMKEGEPGDFFCILAAGQVKVTRKAKLLNLLRAGEPFGEMAYLSKGEHVRGADVTVMHDANIISVPTQMLAQASETCQHKFDRAFMEILVERLSMANLRLSGV